MGGKQCTQEEIKEWQSLRGMGWTYQAIADKYGRSHTTISRHVQDPRPYRVSDNEKAQILDLRRKGWDFEKIARYLRRDVHTIYRWAPSGPRRKTSDSVIRNMRKLRSKGYSYDRIGEFVGTTASTVRKYCKDIEIQGEKKRLKGPQECTEEEIAKMRELFLEGLPLYKIAEKTCRAHTTVRRHTAGLNRRPLTCTEEEIADIRALFLEGYTASEIAEKVDRGISTIKNHTEDLDAPHIEVETLPGTEWLFEVSDYLSTRVHYRNTVRWLQERFPKAKKIIFGRESPKTFTQWVVKRRKCNEDTWQERKKIAAYRQRLERGETAFFPTTAEPHKDYKGVIYYRASCQGGGSKNTGATLYMLSPAPSRADILKVLKKRFPKAKEILLGQEPPTKIGWKLLRRKCEGDTDEENQRIARYHERRSQGLRSAWPTTSAPSRDYEGLVYCRIYKLRLDTATPYMVERPNDE